MRIHLWKANRASFIRSGIVFLITLVTAALGRGLVGGWLPEMSLLPAIGRSVLVGALALITFLGMARLASLDGALGSLGVRLRR